MTRRVGWHLSPLVLHTAECQLYSYPGVPDHTGYGSQRYGAHAKRSVSANDQPQAITRNCPLLTTSHTYDRITTLSTVPEQRVLPQRLRSFQDEMRRVRSYPTIDIWVYTRPRPEVGFPMDQPVVHAEGAMAGAEEFPDIATQEADDVGACRRMLDLVEGQIADLDTARASLVQMRAHWTARLEAAQSGGPIRVGARRAPRGSIRQAILAELREADNGMTADQLSNRLSGRISRFNRRSVSSALARLQDAGLVRYREPCWHSTSDRR